MSDLGYVRFVTHRIDDLSLTWQGIIHAVTDFKNQNDLESYVYDWVHHDLGWLNEYLPVPSCFRQPETGADEGVCWFHPSASEPIARVRSLSAILEEHGIPVRMLWSPNPGRVIYEDRWQIVAAPRPRVMWRRRKPRGRTPQTRQSSRKL